jgi:hypothetical protein
MGEQSRISFEKSHTGGTLGMAKLQIRRGGLAPWNVISTKK